MKLGATDFEELAKSVDKVFTERLAIYKAYAAGATLKSGEWADQTKNAEVFTMPAVGSANQYIVTSSAVAEAKLTTAAKFVGGGLSSSTAILTTGMVAVWQSDGTNWRLIAGEVKREGAATRPTKTKAECEAGIEFSATRPASVIAGPTDGSEFGVGSPSPSVGGVLLINASAARQVSFTIFPGEKFLGPKETTFFVRLL